ncbi:neural cell adhesion molecule fasciclin 2 [Arctopsyche grandis]|uniref:neural cell adhesion molecule fasciclin 2 n=1 Tax=Arctopsyche grandis TaxID=121162 RepID=UPI00406D9B52
MSAHSGVTGATTLRCTAMLLVLLLTAAKGISASEDPKLEIWPLQPVQAKSVGKSLLLTCVPTGADNQLITGMEWRDPSNRTIPFSNPKEQRPPIYVDQLPGLLSLGLFIPSLTESMAGTYYCSAIYSNSQKLHANVTINTIVSITWKNAPDNQYPIKGRDYVVKCEVVANPPPTIDWMRNGDQIAIGGRYLPEPKGLLIKNVQESDDGIYTCRAGVILTGELAERNIRLEVHSPPEIEPITETLEVLEGETASLTCKATGKPQPTFRWTKQNTLEDLSKADRFRVDHHRGILTMSKIEEGDTGPYICMAENNAGTKEIVANVEVIVKPKIYELINVTTSVHLDTKIICKANGRPAPIVSFKKFGTNDYYVVGVQTSDERIILDHQVNKKDGETIATLTISKTHRSDDGLYECMASNKGDKAYKNGHITVQFPPSFEASETQPPVWSWDRRPANLTCLAESIPNATIEWRLNDRILEIQPGYINIEGTGPTSNLIIIPRANQDYTDYKCVARNVLGTSEHIIELKLAEAPDVIQQTRLLSLTATSITFEINGPPERFGLPMRAFVVQYKDKREYDWTRAKNKTWSIDSPYVIENLLPMTSYDFRFAAKNDVGLSIWGGNQQFDMPKRSSPEPPKLLLGSANEGDIVQSPYADHFELRWKIPADNGEPIEVYQLEYCQVVKVTGEWKEEQESCISEEIKSYENTAYKMNQLKPDTFYRIRLRALNIIGSSSPGEMYLRSARGADTTVHRHEGPALSSAAIIGIVIAGVLLMLIVVDVLLCCCRRQGVIATLCYKKSKQHDEDEAKLGSLYGWRFPLPYCSNKEPTAPPSPAPLPPPVKLASTPTDEKEPLKDSNDRVMIDNSMMRNTSVEFDGRRAHAKTGEIIGKNSAV